jgi:hypothetical protein
MTTACHDAGRLSPGADCQPTPPRQADRPCEQIRIVLLPEQAAARVLYSVALLPGFARGMVAGVVRPG